MVEDGLNDELLHVGRLEDFQLNRFVAARLPSAWNWEDASAVGAGYRQIVVTTIGG